ncbi:MAG: class I SAM-dependent methyltransferase [Flavobacteriales bacterium]
MSRFPIKEGYQAIDCGNGRKLEAVGPYVLDRPEPLAEHPTALPVGEWEKLTHARYLEGAKGKAGKWKILRNMARNWETELRTEHLALKASCELAGSKHYGFFPEQAPNWDLLKDRLGRLEEAAPRALLLFAYTGMASLACRSAGADTFHVEASKKAITRARSNMELNGLQDIRWVLEDVMKFVRREERRGKGYRVIVLDPPSFGRGPKGELWKAEDLTLELLEHCSALLNEDRHLLIANLYAQRSPHRSWDPSIERIAKEKGSRSTLRDLVIPSKKGRDIPAGQSLYFEKGFDPEKISDPEP